MTSKRGPSLLLTADPFAADPESGPRIRDLEVVQDQSPVPLEQLALAPQPAEQPCATQTVYGPLRGRATTEEQVMKSRRRVKAYGEVFTQRHMVDRMLDLVREEVESGPDFVDKTFLEPSAGDGNFLVAILHRKLRAIAKRKPRKTWPDESLFALASIYGIELLEDNYRDAKEALLAEFLRFNEDHDVDCDPSSGLTRAATFLIDTNIVRGDTLTGLDWRGEQIEFSWWHRVVGAPGMVRREPFTLASMRGDDTFDFTSYAEYAVCRIDRVHEEVQTGG